MRMGILLLLLFTTACAKQTDCPPGTGLTSEPTVYLYPTVPVHPLVSANSLLSDARRSIRGTGKTAAEILAWYSAALPGAGWRTVPISLPSDKAMVFVKDGEYLSVSGHDVANTREVVVWFHLRSTPVVTREEAIRIARNTHRAEVEWTPKFIKDFQTERYGEVKHPVWVVEATPGNDAVWIDAVTAEAFRIRQ